MSKQNDFIKAPVFGISEDELATGSVNDNEVGVINGKKIKAHSITSDQIAAGAIGAVQLQAGAITAFKITVPNRVKGTTVVFSVGGANNDTLQWTSGVAYLMKMKYTPGDTMGDLQVVQVQQTISAGSYQFKSGDSAYYFYVEWAKDQDSDEPADSATLTIQKSTTYPDSDTAVVLAYAWYDSVLGLAQFQALDNAGGGVRISGNSIIAGSITAQNIKAGTITADRLSFQAFDKSKDTLDSIPDGSQYAKVSRTDISAGHILLDSVIQNGTYGLIRRTYIEDGKLSLTYGVTGKLNNANLDTDNPTMPGLYMTYYHLGYWNGSAWTVDIQSNGTAIFGIDGSSNYLKWDGSTLTVRGNVQANSVVANISISSPYITLSGSGYIAGGKSYFTDTNSGFWLGYYNGYYTFIIGNSSQYLQWDGTTLTVRGDVQASSVVSGISILSPTIMGGTITTSTTGSGQRVQLSSNAYSAIDFYDAGNNHIAQILGDAYLTINSYYYGITLTPNYGGGYGVLVQGILKVSHPYGVSYSKLYFGDSDYIYTDGTHIYWNHNGTNHQLD